MQQLIDWTLPIKTISEANCSEHWTKRHARHKTQKKWINTMFLKEQPSLPDKVHVKLVRISPRALDLGDNLPMSFKAIRDAIASNLRPGKAPGFADADKRISWGYDQEKHGTKEYAVRIEIFSND